MNVHKNHRNLRSNSTKIGRVSPTWIKQHCFIQNDLGTAGHVANTDGGPTYRRRSNGSTVFTRWHRYACPYDTRFLWPTQLTIPDGSLIDRFSRFCTTDAVFYPYVTLCRHVSQKLFPKKLSLILLGGAGPHLNSHLSNWTHSTHRVKRHLY